MRNVWHTVNDDKLEHVDRAVAFLMGEFCPPDVDPIWSAPYFRWKLGPANPAGPGYLTLATAGDKVVGAVSLTRKRLLIAGKECAGGEVGDSYSSASMRRGAQPAELDPGDNDPSSYINKSIFGRLASATRLRAEADGIRIIYGTPNQNAYPGWTKRLQFFELERCGLTTYVRPAAKMAVSIYPRIAGLDGVLKSMEAASLAVLKWTWSRHRRRGQTLERGIPALGELDELWQRTQSPDRCSLVRDARYWTHRYLEHPLARYELFSIREAGRLCGLVVTRMFIAAKGRLQLSIVEWMVEWMNEERVSFGWLLTELADAYKDSGIELYHLYAGEATTEARALARQLFLRRGRVPVILADTREARQLQLDSCRVELYLGSTDAA